MPLPLLTLLSAVPVKEHRNPALLKPGARGKSLLSLWPELLVGMVGPKQNVALTVQGIVFPIVFILLVGENRENENLQNELCSYTRI